MITMQVLLAAILLGWLYALIFARWQRGLYWLVTYLPFAGAVTIAMNLWWPSLLLKDILFVIPLYIAFFARFVFAPECLAGFPRRVAYLMLCLLILTLVQARNSGVANPIMALIGLKVWFSICRSVLSLTHSSIHSSECSVCFACSWPCRSFRR